MTSNISTRTYKLCAYSGTFQTLFAVFCGHANVLSIPIAVVLGFASVQYHQSCWRHIRKRSICLLPVDVLMIVYSTRIYNKTQRLEYIPESERFIVPSKLIVYEENMLKCTGLECYVIPFLVSSSRVWDS